MRVTCGQCGEAFEAKRSTRKYCGDTCRQQARRRSVAPAAGAEAPFPDLVDRTRTELVALAKLDTVLGAQAMTLAARMTSNKDTGSAIAALSRELDRVMLRLRGGGEQQEDEVASARRRRDQKRADAQARASSS